MSAELKYKNKTIVKVDSDRYVSTLFDMQMPAKQCGYNPLFSFKNHGHSIFDPKVSMTVKQHNEHKILLTSHNALFEIQSLWSLCCNTGILSRKDTFFNKGNEAVKLSRALQSFTFSLDNYEIYSETSEWCYENQGAWQELLSTADTIILKNAGGRTTQGGTPYMCLREKKTGTGMIFHIVPRGNWIIRISSNSNTSDDAENLLIELGLSDEHLNLSILPDGSFELPEILMQTLPADGIEAAAPKLHQYEQNKCLKNKSRNDEKSFPAPIVYNSWFDWFDKLEVSRLRKQLDAAKQTGCEVFVIDAGWYGASNATWSAQTGDWRENLTSAFKGKMFQFAEEVRDAGLGFGLWMEPERLCENVPILKKHPQWFLQGAGECYYPNIALPKVNDYVFSEISRLIDTYQLVWMKIDFNFQLGTDPSGAEFADYYSLWYQMLERLKEKYPYMFFEGCASGGMRLDLNTLSHFDGHFLSDNVNPWDILRISQSAALRLPLSRIIRWAVLRNIEDNVPTYGEKITFEDRMITPAGNAATWNEFESVNFDFAILAALPGIFGLSGDLASFSEKQKIKLKEYILFYKQWRSFIAGSSVALLTSIGPLGNRNGWIAFQMINPACDKMLIFVYRLENSNNKMSFKLDNIDPKYNTEVILKPSPNMLVSEISKLGTVEVTLPEQNTACCILLSMSE